MKQTPLARKTPLKSSPARTQEFNDRARQKGSQGFSRPRPVSPASPQQRLKIGGSLCVVCGQGPADPAHVIDRSLCPTGADDPRAVIPLCRPHHREYDDHRLSLLEYLEPTFREELAFAVERFGLVSTYKRLTGDWGMERV